MEEQLNYSYNQESAFMCRICLQEKPPLISCCNCSYCFHKSCLENWLIMSNRKTCEICNGQFKLQSFFMPLNQWNWPSLKELSTREFLLRCIKISSLFFTLSAIILIIYLINKKKLECNSFNYELNVSKENTTTAFNETQLNNISFKIEQFDKLENNSRIFIDQETQIKTCYFSLSSMIMLWIFPICILIYMASISVCWVFSLNSNFIKWINSNKKIEVINYQVLKN